MPTLAVNANPRCLLRISLPGKGEGQVGVTGRHGDFQGSPGGEIARRLGLGRGALLPGDCRQGVQQLLDLQAQLVERQAEVEAGLIG